MYFCRAIPGLVFANPSAIVLFCFFLFAGVDSTTTTRPNLRCRYCNFASSLNDCTHSVPCGYNEVCYLDEIITDTLQVIYNAGCRSKDVCTKTGSMAFGKKRDLVSCSHCCDVAGTPECNTRLCGIKPDSQAPAWHMHSCPICYNTSAPMCYNCENGVADPSTCTTLTTCQSDQMCGSEKLYMSGQSTYVMRCINKRLCTFLMQEALKRKKACMDGTGLCPHVRQGTKLCTACCGDGYCNGGKCEDIIDRLYTFWMNNKLDFNTLEVIT